MDYSKTMVDLFGVQVPTISKHLKNIFADGELDEEVVISKMEITIQHGAIEGKTQTSETDFYNLDAIISVGYRVKSNRGVEFRKWANKVLKQYIIQGYAINEKRLEALQRTVSIQTKMLASTLEVITSMITFDHPR